MYSDKKLSINFCRGRKGSILIQVFTKESVAQGNKEVILKDSQLFVLLFFNNGKINNIENKKRFFSSSFFSEFQLSNYPGIPTYYLGLKKNSPDIIASFLFEFVKEVYAISEEEVFIEVLRY